MLEHAMKLLKIYETQTQNMIHHLLQIGGPISINLVTGRSSAVLAKKRNHQSSLNTEENPAKKYNTEEISGREGGREQRKGE